MEPNTVVVAAPILAAVRKQMTCPIWWDDVFGHEGCVQDICISQDAAFAPTLECSTSWARQVMSQADCSASAAAEGSSTILISSVAVTTPSASEHLILYIKLLLSPVILQGFLVIQVTSRHSHWFGIWGLLRHHCEIVHTETCTQPIRWHVCSAASASFQRLKGKASRHPSARYATSLVGSEISSLCMSWPT